jgi:hypothetical protein
MYLDVRGGICCLMVFVSIFTQFLALLCLDDGPCWGRNWLSLNKQIDKSMLDVTGEFLDLCD